MYSKKVSSIKGFLLLSAIVLLLATCTHPFFSMRIRTRSSGPEGHSNGETEKTIETKNRALGDFLEIPTIVSGDTWTYHTDLDVTAHIVFDALNFDLDGTLTGDTTFTADGIINTYANGTRYLCYKIDFSGTFLLDASGMSGLINVAVDADIKGSEYRSVADISMVKKDTFQSGTVSITSLLINDEFGFNLTSNVTYKMPEEEYDFPVFVNEKWNQTFDTITNNTGDFGGNPVDDISVESISKMNNCTGTTLKVVTAGTFDTYIVGMDSGSEIRYFSEDARYIVFTQVNSGSFMESENLSVNINGGSIELTSFDVGPHGTVLQVNAPRAIAPNSTILLSGNIPGIASGNIDIHIPGEDISLTTSITNGNFQRSIYMEERTDHTPSLLNRGPYWGNVTDIGSHGVIVSYNDLNVHRVLTVTLAEPDVRIFSENITFGLSRPNETISIVRETVHINITVENPSYVPIQNLDVRLYHQGAPVGSDSTIDIPPMNKTTFQKDWTAVGPVGLHQFSVTLDPNGVLNESQKSNNIADADLNVSDRPVPLITDLTPPQWNISIYEEESIHFSVWVEELPGGSYNKTWYFKRGSEENFTELIRDRNDFQFITHYLGDSSSSGSPFTFRFHVSDGAALVERSQSVTWNVTVLNYDQTLNFTAYPDPGEIIQIKENETKNFSVVGEDPDGTTPIIEWLFDNNSLNISSYFFQYTPDFFSSGYLFSLGPDYKRYLKNGTVNNTLKKAFENNSQVFSKGAALSKIDEEWWEITDGSKRYRIQNTSTELNVYSSGRHNLTLHIKDGEDPENISRALRFNWTIDVINRNRNCTANISTPLNSSTFEVGEFIDFSAKGSWDPDIESDKWPTILNYTWDFEDDTTAHGMKVNHTYDERGSYSVELRVRDPGPEGAFNAMLIELTIVPSPPDLDGDGIPDEKDPDIDGDGIINENDAYPRDPERWKWEQPVNPEEETDTDELSKEHITAAFLIGTGLVILIIVLSFLAIERWRKRAEEEGIALAGKEGISTLITNLVELENEREETLDRIDRIIGKLEQLDWELEDGSIARERYDNLVTRYQHRLNQLSDEVAEMEDQIDYLERTIKRGKRRRESKKRMYGGHGSDDFYQPDYREIEDEFAGEDEEEEQFLDEDEYWAEESEEEPKPIKRRRYYEDYDDGCEGYEETYEEEGDPYEEEDYEEEEEYLDDEEDYEEEEEHYEDHLPRRSQSGRYYEEYDDDYYDGY